MFAAGPDDVDAVGDFGVVGCDDESGPPVKRGRVVSTLPLPVTTPTRCPGVWGGP